MFHKLLGSVAVIGASIVLIFGGYRGEAQADAPEEIVITVPDVAETPMTKAEAIEKVIEEPVMVIEMKFNDIPLTEDEQMLIRELSRVMEIDYRFAYALIWSESGFVWQTGDHNLNHQAIGYFQISTINEARLKKDYGLNIYDRFDNLEAGMRIIQELTEKFKDGYGEYDTETAVIMCYKCGTSRGTELMDEGFTLEVVQTIKDKKAEYDL